MAWWAHVGGFVLGMVVALARKRVGEGEDRRREELGEPTEATEDGTEATEEIRKKSADDSFGRLQDTGAITERLEGRPVPGAKDASQVGW